jgi:hypothetical protein
LEQDAEMTWNFATGCVIGGAAALVVALAFRGMKYLSALWRVVASVEPRRPPGGDASVSGRETSGDPNQNTDHPQRSVSRAE